MSILNTWMSESEFNNNSISQIKFSLRATQNGYHEMISNCRAAIRDWLPPLLSNNVTPSNYTDFYVNHLGNRPPSIRA